MGSITLKQVTKSFGSTNVIPPLDLQINHGEFVVFVGPSGCGKVHPAAPDCRAGRRHVRRHRD